MARAEALSVEVVYCAGPDAVDRVTLRLPAGSCVRDALTASGVLERHPEADAGSVGVWGRSRPQEHALRDGDRVELYRPLRVDPMQARRLRAGRQRMTRR